MNSENHLRGANSPKREELVEVGAAAQLFETVTLDAGTPRADATAAAIADAAD
jgi:hypothetical protein